MCGIFGFVGHLSPDLAWASVDSLAHRGPDGRGLWQTPEVTLGHRRLAILDPSPRGHQPMSYLGGRYHITLNGEIYNFLELREELRDQYPFESDSDTEVLLACFARWGAECLDRLNGMWAFAIWDDAEKRLFLARDRFGKKPLFHARVQGGFAFASEMKALFPLLREVRPNVELVRDGLRLLRYESTRECLIEGIERLPAGHFAWFRGGQLETRRWWCTLDRLPAVPARFEEQAEQLRELLLDACKLRMRSDVALGTALSGGLDSSAVASGMAHAARRGGARIDRRWQHAFVASFPGTPLDETAYARAVADHLGIELTVVEIDARAALDRLDDYFYLFEEIYSTSPIPFMLTYEAVKAHGVSVTLDGHGADELFGGYRFDFVRALGDAGWNLLRARQVLDAYYDSQPSGSPQYPGLPGKVPYLAGWHLKRLARRLLRRPPEPARDEGHPAWRDLDGLTRVLYVSTHETVLPSLLRNYDRYSMASGVEIRMPFLDHRIARFAFALPWHSKLRGGYSKAVVRAAVAPLLPPEIAFRKTKIGFSSPAVDWMKGPLRQFILDTIASRPFLSCALIDPEQTAREVRRVINDPQATFHMGEAAWTLLAPYLWEQSVLRRARESRVAPMTA
jgi:asparagine synthase (glutamine-hydrolysing)